MTNFPPQPDPNHNPGAAGQAPHNPPPSGGFLTEWGIKPHPVRPQKVTLLLQSLWVYAAASALIALFALIAAASLPYYFGTGYFTSAAIISLIFGAGALTVAWFIVKEKLGLLGSNDPRITLSIGLGIIGFFALYGFFGGWNVGWYSTFGVLLGMARLGAVGLAFAMVFQPETLHWLRSRPGNLPNPGPQQPYGTQPHQAPGPNQPPLPPHGAGQQPGAAPGQQPPAPGQPPQQ
ncbi:hypothetical protein [Natronoglycomyces albus]|uniref:Uncharacterized protein n=1 Tax=Natronoglycomyces albus TaxID=2811108 RepID=A0A895XSR5_9ACTN|nr:hypothetical protein [Natronoglycomyces albus]QSB06702.1 hypothetical protein JQS30_07360 [Natronoglycomyces albus]